MEFTRIDDISILKINSLLVSDRPTSVPSEYIDYEVVAFVRSKDKKMAVPILCKTLEEMQSLYDWSIKNTENRVSWSTSQFDEQSANGHSFNLDNF